MHHVVKNGYNVSGYDLRVCCIAFDGKWFASGSADGAVRIWDCIFWVDVGGMDRQQHRQRKYAQENTLFGICAGEGLRYLLLQRGLGSRMVPWDWTTSSRGIDGEV